MLLIIAWVVLANLALFCLYRRAKRRRRVQMIRRRVEESLNRMDITITPLQIVEMESRLNLRDIVER